MKPWKLLFLLCILGSALAQPFQVLAHHNNMKEHIVEYAPYWIPLAVALIVLGIRLWWNHGLRLFRPSRKV